jgi:hypothetical protein
MHCTTLHSTTLHYTTLHQPHALHYTTLHHTTLPSTTLYYTTLHYTHLLLFRILCTDLLAICVAVLPRICFSLCGRPSSTKIKFTPVHVCGCVCVYIYVCVCNNNMQVHHTVARTHTHTHTYTHTYSPSFVRCTILLNSVVRCGATKLSERRALFCTIHMLKSTAAVVPLNSPVRRGAGDTHVEHHSAAANTDIVYSFALLHTQKRHILPFLPSDDCKPTLHLSRAAHRPCTPMIAANEGRVRRKRVYATGRAPQHGPDVMWSV